MPCSRGYYFDGGFLAEQFETHGMHDVNNHGSSYVSFIDESSALIDMKVSEEEITFLTDGMDPYSDEAALKLFTPNLRLLLVTEGSEGCRYYCKVNPCDLPLTK